MLRWKPISSAGVLMEGSREPIYHPSACPLYSGPDPTAYFSHTFPRSSVDLLLLQPSTCTIDQTCNVRPATAILSMLLPRRNPSTTQRRMVQAVPSVPVRILTKTGRRSQILPSAEEYRTESLKETIVSAISNYNPICNRSV